MDSPRFRKWKEVCKRRKDITLSLQPVSVVPNIKRLNLVYTSTFCLHQGKRWWQMKEWEEEYGSCLSVFEEALPWSSYWYMSANCINLSVSAGSNFSVMLWICPNQFTELSYWVCRYAIWGLKVLIFPYILHGMLSKKPFPGGKCLWLNRCLQKLETSWKFSSMPRRYTSWLWSSPGAKLQRHGYPAAGRKSKRKTASPLCQEIHKSPFLSW